MQVSTAFRSAPRRLLAALVITCVFSAAHAAAPAIAQPPASSATPPRVARPGDNPETLRAAVEDFDRLARALADSGAVPAIATVVVKDGKVLSQHAYGVTTYGSGDAVSTKTVFRLASLSKAFAATLAGVLVEQGWLRWDDKVQDLVPAFVLKDERAAGRLTIEELLSHRVGLPRNAEDPLLERDEPYPMLVYRLRDVPMSCGVGECYGYQNVAFALISDVTFAATGDFFSHQVERRLFHPLGMNTATYGRAALESSAQWARPHVRGFRGAWRAVPVRETYYHVPPAAGVNASIEDMTPWLLAHLGHRTDVLSKSLVDQLHGPRVVTPGEGGTSPWRRERVRRAQYALGWRVYDYMGERLVFHAGAVQGYRGMVGLLPDYDFGVAMLWNCESSKPSGLLPTLLDAYLGLPARQWVDPDEDAPAKRAVVKSTPKAKKAVAKPAAKPLKRRRK
jgi:beta-lactamase class C